MLVALVIAIVPAGAVSGASSAGAVSLGPLASRGRSGVAVALDIPAPLVRVGISTDARRLTLSSKGGFHLVDARAGRDLWRRTHQGDLHIVLDRKDGNQASAFRVQVASLRDAEEAEAMRARIEAETGEVATVTPDPDRHAFRVRVGQAPTRDAVQAVEQKIRAMGFAETWIVEETAGGRGKVRVRLVDENYNDLLTEPRTMLALPAVEGSPIEVDDKTYRGAVEIVVTGLSRLRAVNVVNLEDYLRGVVPSELGPTLYPELEALKAQAIAARTYAVANRGQFASEGYDLCDTPRCQVYEGVKGEDAMSDRAVAETAGLILTYDGRPINALYTATCGGHTEDGANVFSQEKGAYLKGVECYADEVTLALWRRTLRGATPFPPLVTPAGESIEEALALLSVLGIFDAGTGTPARMAETITSTETAEATRRTLTLIGKNAAAPLPDAAYPSVADLAHYLVAAFGWQERVSLLLDPRDLPSFLGVSLLTSGVPSGAREAALLVKEGIFPPRLGAGSGFLQPATRAFLYRALHRLVARYDAAGLEKGIFRGSRGASLLIVPDADEMKGLPAAREVTPATAPWLSRDAGEGAQTVVDEVALVAGDRLSWHRGADGAADFIRMKANVRGASDDRFTNSFQWESRFTRQELQDRIRERASIGELIDVLPGRRGVSGRVTDLVVVGSAGRFTFRGFPIRTLLGLRENLFVVDRQRDTDGRVMEFIFTGKGWGHGVGLCQVGAFGMALRGARYDEILNHYYTGVRIEALAPAGRALAP